MRSYSCLEWHAPHDGWYYIQPQADWLSCSHSQPLMASALLICLSLLFFCCLLHPSALYCAILRGLGLVVMTPLWTTGGLALLCRLLLLLTMQLVCRELRWFFLALHHRVGCRKQHPRERMVLRCPAARAAGATFTALVQHRTREHSSRKSKKLSHGLTVNL